MLGFSALSETALSELPSAAPAGGVSGDLAITFEFAVSGSAAHGVAGSGAVDVTFSVSADAAHGVAGSGAVTLTFDVSGAAMYGASESGSGGMKLSNALDASGYRIMNVADPVADQDAMTSMSLTPTGVAGGKTLWIPYGKQMLFALPITFYDSGKIALDGAMVEVH